MKHDIFTEKFWIEQWENIKKEDTFNVHKGFSGAEFWDKVSRSYNIGSKEISSKGITKSIDIFKKNNCLFPGVKILEIGCGTGLLAKALAKEKALVTAIDFSSGMLERFKRDLPKNLEKNINIILMDWKQADIKKMGWIKEFDLVIAFMSPAVSTPATLFKMMDASRNACAIKGWAGKRKHPVLDGLWKEITGKELNDKILSLVIKFNLLFAMGFFPELYCDTISWKQKISIAEEIDNKLAFFKKVSDKPEAELKNIIENYMHKIADNDTVITKNHKGMTATIFWKINKSFS